MFMAVPFLYSTSMLLLPGAPQTKEIEFVSMFFLYIHHNLNETRKFSS